MKKLIAFIMVLVFALCAFGVGHASKVNSHRYYAEALCTQEDGALVFTFYDNSFIWELNVGDKIPTEKVVVLVMDNNGTEGYLADDSIISYH